MLIDPCLESSVKRVGKKKYVSNDIMLHPLPMVPAQYIIHHCYLLHFSASFIALLHIAALFLSLSFFSFSPSIFFQFYFLLKCHHHPKQMGTGEEHHWSYPIVQHPYILSTINSNFHPQRFKFPAPIMMFVQDGLYYAPILQKVLM